MRKRTLASGLRFRKVRLGGRRVQSRFPGREKGLYGATTKVGGSRDIISADGVLRLAAERLVAAARRAEILAHAARTATLEIKNQQFQIHRRPAYERALPLPGHAAA